MRLEPLTAHVKRVKQPMKLLFVFLLSDVRGQDMKPGGAPCLNRLNALRNVSREPDLDGSLRTSSLDEVEMCLPHKPRAADVALPSRSENTPNEQFFVAGLDGTPSERLENRDPCQLRVLARKVSGKTVGLHAANGADLVPCLSNGLLCSACLISSGVLLWNGPTNLSLGQVTLGHHINEGLRELVQVSALIKTVITPQVTIEHLDAVLTTQ